MIAAGHDVLGMSPTGSGKTIAFGAPIADRIEASDRRPAALILAPTRELTAQIVDDLRPMAQARALRIASVYGGVGIVKQAREAAHAHIVVATPGRLEDLCDRGQVRLSGRSRGNKLVHLSGDPSLVGRAVVVRIEHAGPYALRGTLVDA